MNFIKLAVAALLALGASTALAEPFSAEKKAEIDAMIRAYILDNPEVIVEAMQVLEQRRTQAQAASDAALVARLGDRLTNDGYSYVGGDPDGDVTMVEFLDYRCGYCKQAHEGVKALLASDPKVRFVIKEFPILGPQSTFASRAALASLKQGGDLYLAFSDALMEFQGELGEPVVFGLATEVGLDVARLRADMDDPAIAESINKTYALAREMGVNGTPAFVIGDQIVRGFVPYDTLREMVEIAREAG